MRSIAIAMLLALALYGCGSKTPTKAETDVAQVEAATRKPAADGAVCGSCGHGYATCT